MVLVTNGQQPCLHHGRAKHAKAPKSNNPNPVACITGTASHACIYNIQWLHIHNQHRYIQAMPNGFYGFAKQVIL